MLYTTLPLPTNQFTNNLALFNEEIAVATTVPDKKNIETEIVEEKVKFFQTSSNTTQNSDFLCLKKPIMLK